MFVRYRRRRVEEARRRRGGRVDVAQRHETFRQHIAQDLAGAAVRISDHRRPKAQGLGRRAPERFRFDRQRISDVGERENFAQIAAVAEQRNVGLKIVGGDQRPQVVGKPSATAVAAGEQTMHGASVADEACDHVHEFFLAFPAGQTTRRHEQTAAVQLRVLREKAGPPGCIRYIAGRV